MFKAKDVMTTTVVSVKATATVDDVVALLLRHHVSGLVVVDGDEHPIGVITEYDLLKLLYDLEETHDTIDQHMSTQLELIQEDTVLTDVADMFLASRVRRLPVVSADGKLAGILSRRDLIRFIRDARQRVAMEMNQLAEV